MPSVTIRFYEELNDFLTEERRKRPFSVSFADGCSVKAIIEDLGVPHTEVDLILANGESVDFTYRLLDNDTISVYPVFESFDIGRLSRVREQPLREPRFALDVHLGKLARLLVMFGFDAWYARDAADEELARFARREGRIVLSRDRGLLKRRIVTHGYVVRSLVPREQLAEVLKRFDLRGRVRLFSRCIVCNAPLQPVDRESVFAAIPPIVAERYTVFSRCPVCGRVFWRGSHWERMKTLAAQVLSEHPGSQE
jgi:uncharacterized protein with PIN domain